MSNRGRCVRGTHAQFAELYERFLDAVYPPGGCHGTGSGRWKLMRSVAAEMRQRGATQVLDCAAGTGFPMLDLAADAPDEFRIHCADGDPAMVAILAQRAADLGLDPLGLTPPPWPSRARQSKGLATDWASLTDIEGRYDYVLCRGNSLAYADTWTGRSRVAPEALIETYLSRMARKVRPGGHLHVDAPWSLELPTRSYRPLDAETGRFWEQVTPCRGRREWWLSFKPGDGGPALSFKRYSSLLTIDRVEVALQKLGFEETTPIRLAAERPTFGVIIARRPIGH